MLTEDGALRTSSGWRDALIDLDAGQVLQRHRHQILIRRLATDPRRHYDQA